MFVTGIKKDCDVEFAFEIYLIYSNVKAKLFIFGENSDSCVWRFDHGSDKYMVDAMAFNTVCMFYVITAH